MKILASDLDGTLFREQEIAKNDISALKKLKDNGHKFIISTGRNLRGVKEIFKDYKDVDADYLVLCNGALVLDGNFEVVYNKRIDSVTATNIIKDFIDDENICFVLDNGIDTCLIKDKYIREQEFNLESFATKIFSKDEIINLNTDYQIISLYPRSKSIEESEDIKKKILDKYGDNVEVFRNQYYLDVVPKGCSKGRGLKKVIDGKELKVDNLYTIGDSFNDISMFEITNNSYTFNYAEEKIKEIAKNHVNHVHECIDEILGA
jgi:Cof subfamily protein (haloacid dehalogenase superfamily)